ncbi:MAG TPA: hypothetical protein VII56_10095 [Rhizomicrobium sp.]
MRVGRGAMLALLAVGLSGCATWVQGTRQDIAIATPPTQSAVCVVTRKGEHWAVTTPGVLHIDKSIYDLGIHCARQGFEDADATIPSSLESWTLGNLAFGGFPMAIDAADGAMGSYPDAFELRMTPLAGASLPELPLVESPATPLPSIPRPPPPPAPSQPPLPGTLPDNF